MDRFTETFVEDRDSGQLLGRASACDHQGTAVGRTPRSLLEESRRLHRLYRRRPSNANIDFPFPVPSFAIATKPSVLAVNGDQGFRETGIKQTMKFRCFCLPWIRFISRLPSGLLQY